MSYRKLEVDGKQYEYVIGKKNTKIRGGATYLNEAIGDRINGNDEDIIVTPYNVANAIRGISNPRTVRRCSHGIVTHEVVANPYAAEIDGEYSPMINCAICVQNAADDI